MTRRISPPGTSHARRLAWFVLVSFAAMALFSGARCYPDGSRVVIFIQGVYTTYDENGTQSTVLEGQRFNVLKNAFHAKGYDPKSLIDFSYAGGEMRSDGMWQAWPYDCETTDRSAEANLVTLEAMLRDYRKRHPDAHIALVGHSLGGYLAFLEGAREAQRGDADKLGIDAIVTLDAPLKGVSVDKKPIFDLIPCEKTYIAGAELVAQKLDPATPDLRRDQAAAMTSQGIRVATLGNEWDCLYNTNHCVAGGTWADDSSTQTLEGQASISTTYQIDSFVLLSHDAILADAKAVADATAFVGAP